MALVADRVLEGSTTTGTGNFTLTGAFAGHRSFNAAFASASSVLYCIEDGVNWEVGVGTFTAPSTLVRSTVQSSSNGGSLVDFPVGAKRVFNTYTASSLAPASGGASGLEMTVSTTTTDADPGTGVIRWNNSTQASATSLFIDNADSNSASLATLWASTQSGSFLKIINAADSDNWQQWKVTATPVNGTGYYKFTVSLQASSGSAFANGAAVLLDVDESGSGGSSSASGISITDAGSYFTGTDVEAALQELGASGGGGVYGQNNAFVVTLSANQTGMSSGGYAKVNFDSKVADTGNAFDAVTNHRFQPVVAGYYLISLLVSYTATAAQYAYAIIYKNGVAYAPGTYDSLAGKSGVVSVASCVVYLNGSTDYIEGFAYCDGSGPTFNSGAGNTIMSGALLSTTASGVPMVSYTGNNSGDITAPTSWSALTSYSVSIPASVGDQLKVRLNVSPVMTSGNGVTRWRVAYGGNAANDVRYHEVAAASGGNKVAAFEWTHTVVAGDLSGGLVSVAAQWLSTTTAIYVVNSVAGGDNLLGNLTVENFGDGSGVPARASRGVLPIASSTSIVIEGRSFDNFRVSALAHNTTIADPINMTDGQSGMLRIKQDGTGGRTIAFSSKWKRIGDAVTLVTTAAAVVVISYEYDATDDTVVYAIQNVA